MNVLLCLIPQMYKKIEDLEDVVLLKIKTDGLNIEFSYDPYAENCVFTTENVPPEYIISATKIPIKIKK